MFKIDKIFIQIKQYPVLFVILLTFQILLVHYFPGYAFLGNSVNFLIRCNFAIVGSLGLLYLFSSINSIKRRPIEEFVNLPSPFQNYLNSYVKIISWLPFTLLSLYIYKRLFVHNFLYMMLISISTILIQLFLHYIREQKE